MAGLVPATRRGTAPPLMTGTSPGHDDAESASVVVSSTWNYAINVTAAWVRFVTSRCIGKASLFFDDVLPILRQQVLLARDIGRLAARGGAKLGQYR